MTLYQKICLFVGLTFLLSWALWSPVILAPKSLPTLVEGCLMIAGGFGPAIAALSLWPFGAPLTLKTVFHPRTPWKAFFLGALAIPALLISVRCVLPLHVSNREFFDTLPLTFLVMLYLIPMVLGEELGWRGYLLPAFLQKYSFAFSSITVGLIWSFWHLPFFFVGYFPLLFGNFLLTFLLYTLQTTCCSILIAWLFLAGNKRIWIPCLIHASNNAFTIATPLSFTDGERLQVWGTVLVLATLACGLILKFQKANTRTNP